MSDEKKETGEEMLARLRQGLKDGSTKIEFAPVQRTEALDEDVQYVLEALGHPEAFVTDMSSLSDFVDLTEGEAGRTAWLMGLEDKLGLPLELNDLIVDVALKLRRRVEA